MNRRSFFLTSVVSGLCTAAGFNIGRLTVSRKVAYVIVWDGPTVAYLATRGENIIWSDSLTDAITFQTREDAAAYGDVCEPDNYTIGHVTID